LAFGLSGASSRFSLCYSIYSFLDLVSTFFAVDRLSVAG